MLLLSLSGLKNTLLACPAITWLLLSFPAVAWQPAPIRVVKISAGPSGTESNGAFRLDAERAIFSRSSDREVIVLFEWEQVPGMHKLVAEWRSADGGAGVTSAIDYKAADKRFGAYWRLPLTPATTLGRWSIDATIDGQPAGRFTFEVTDARVDSPLSRRPLTEAELYVRLDRSFVVLRRDAADGRALDAAAGFRPVPANGRIYTVVPALDSTESVRAVSADRTVQAITRAVALDRRHQWAILESAPASGPALPVRSGKPLEIGGRCFSIEGTADGVRVLTGGTVTGQVATSPGTPPVLVVTFPTAFGMPGAPVVDEYGELFGIIGAGVPGDPRPIEHVVAARGDLKGAPVISFPLADAAASATPSELSSLRAAGALMTSVVGGQTVTGGFMRGAVKSSAGPADFVGELPATEKTVSAVLTWAPVDRLRGQVFVRLFDADNRLIGESQPRKIDYKKGAYVRSSWQFPVPHTPGTYRVDALVDANTYWRGFFRVNP